jgi:hypothetical protein
MWSTCAFPRSDDDPQVALGMLKTHFAALSWHFHQIQCPILTTNPDFRRFERAATLGLTEDPHNRLLLITSEMPKPISQLINKSIADEVLFLIVTL